HGASGFPGGGVSALAVGALDETAPSAADLPAQPMVRRLARARDAGAYVCRHHVAIDRRPRGRSRGLHALSGFAAAAAPAVLRRPTLKNRPPSCPSVRIHPSCASQASARQLSAATVNRSSGSSDRKSV